MADKPTVGSSVGTYDLINSSKSDLASSISNSILKSDDLQKMIDDNETASAQDKLNKKSKIRLTEQIFDNTRAGNTTAFRVEVLVRNIVYSILVDIGLVDRVEGGGEEGMDEGESETITL
jgi:hypothetical protein